MQRIRGTAAALFAAVVLIGCSQLVGGPDQPVDGGAAPEPPIDPPVSDSLRVEPVPGIVDARPHAIERFVIGPDGRTVVVHWVGGVEECFGLDRVEVDASGDVPRITVFEGTRPDAVGRACIMLGVLKSAVVVLDEQIIVDRHGEGGPGGEPLGPIVGEPVEVEPGLVNQRPVALVGYELDAAGRQLTIAYVGGTDVCYGLAELTVDPGPPLIVAVWEGSRANGDVACPDIGVAKVISVELPAAVLTDGAGGG